MAFGSKNQGNNARKRAYAPKPLSELISGVINPIIERKAGMSGDLIAVWADLVGPEQAEYTQPQKLLWSRHHGELDEFSPATLVVACEASQALYFQHETSRIIQQVNTYFGFAAIDRVKIVQKSTVTVRPEKHRPRINPSPEQKAKARQLTENVENDKLRESLKRLGEGVFSRHSSGK